MQASNNQCGSPLLDIMIFTFIEEEKIHKRE